MAGNAGMMTGPGTNTYLLGEDEIAVLDPGPDEAPHLSAILGAAGAPIRWIVVTHTHRDHSPLAARAGAAHRRHPHRVAAAPRWAAGRKLCAAAPAGGWRAPASWAIFELTAIHTPGHASNCVCYFLARERLLITGDHVLEGVSPVILPPDGNMGDYLNSIDKLFAYDFEKIAPGHGDLMDHGKKVLEALRAHRLAREDKVLRNLDQAARSQPRCPDTRGLR